MKFFIIILFIPFFSNSQIPISSSLESEKKYAIKVYDSSSNFPSEDISTIIGQTLYVLPTPNFLGYESYYEFSYDIKGKEIAFPKIGERKISVTDSLINKPFKVIDFIDYTDRKIIKLENILNSNIIYYGLNRYSISSMDWPFVTEGYFKKMEHEYTRNPYISRINKFMKVANSKDSVRIKFGDKFKVKYLTLLKDNYYQLGALVENTNGDEFLITKWDIDDSLTIEDANNYKRKYPSFYRLILEKKIGMNMPKNALLASWGKPKEINKANYGEQWIYESHYVYLENGRITGWN